MDHSELSRLTGTDASFLVQERSGSNMHIGGVMVFEGPMPDIASFKTHLASRLHLVPRYRQRLCYPPMQAGRPFWADDPDFNLAYHVRDAALPAPGNDEQLERLCARIFSQRLDRRKPLWEMWLVDGLSGGRFAMILKTHHAVVDGIAGVDVGTVLLNVDPTEEIEPPKPWRPRPLPTQSEMLEIGARELAKAPFQLAERLRDVVTDRNHAREDVSNFVGGLTKAVTETIDAAPRSPLNTEISQHRRFKLVRNSLEDFKEIKNLLDTTVNDVVLTVTSDALGRWLRTRHYPTDGLKLRALVPVSTRPRRPGRDGAASGNELLAMRGELPVHEMDALERLNYIKNSMDDLKHSNQAVAADALTAVQNFAPPTVLAQASRINFSTRLFNLLVTNVPGPQIPLYLLGRQLIDAFPIPFLAENHALAVAVMSYNGRINFGLLGDYDAMSDIQVIADGIADSRDDLLAAAQQVKTKVKQVMRSSVPPEAVEAVVNGGAANGKTSSNGAAAHDEAPAQVSSIDEKRRAKSSSPAKKSAAARKQPAKRKPASRKSAAKRPSNGGRPAS